MVPQIECVGTEWPPPFHYAAAVSSVYCVQTPPSRMLLQPAITGLQFTLTVPPPLRGTWVVLQSLQQSYTLWPVVRIDNKTVMQVDAVITETLRKMLGEKKKSHVWEECK